MLSAFSHRLGLTTVPAATQPQSEGEGEAAQEEDDNEPPPFPLPNSIQRAGGSASTSAPPPPFFSFDSPPPTTYGSDDEGGDEDGVNLPAICVEPEALAAPTGTTKRKRVRVKIEKGYSQLDWGRLQRSGADLRGGVQQLGRITTSELARHKTKEDCWQAYGGKVYNVTPFLKYHPGGVPELMRVAGKDGTELFMKTHAWVNADLMLDGCLVGFLVRD